MSLSSIRFRCEPRMVRCRDATRRSGQPIVVGRMPLSKTVNTMFVPPCIPTRAHKAPAGPDWVHEIKHDGYRLQVRREGNTVRLFTPAAATTGPAATRRSPSPRCCCAPSRSRSTERPWCAAPTASPSSTRSTGAAPFPRLCYRSGPSRDWQDQEPGQPGDDPGAGSGVVNFATRGTL
jgi:hypothetical protein